MSSQSSARKILKGKRQASFLLPLFDINVGLVVLSPSSRQSLNPKSLEHLILPLRPTPFPPHQPRESFSLLMSWSLKTKLCIAGEHSKLPMLYVHLIDLLLSVRQKEIAVFLIVNRPLVPTGDSRSLV